MSVEVHSRSQIGTPEYFGRHLQALRKRDVGHRFDVYAHRLGLGTFDYTQIESGRGQMPTPDEVYRWGDTLNLGVTEKVNLLHAAGMPGLDDTIVEYIAHVSQRLRIR